MNPKVNFFFDNDTRWKDEFNQLRRIVLDCGLTEELKWGKPCYTYKNKNILLIHGFKEYCALLFHKGALLKNEENLLIRQTDNVQAARQLRFTSSEEIIKLAPSIKAYIYEAIEVEKAGINVELKKTDEYEVPEELQKKLEESPDFRAAFQALTPGRQRGYLLYFSQAKQAKTRIARIEKYMPKILEGKGYNDR
ncbi:YdeI/OmpD-associated family protein [Echinicola shivajiensis]|uniref:YdeI/OmpD-associated family protein n=1 Tax=Echinicola shivajiensis TaxID=1035916 RepID=UPI001BFC1D6E|nr:YdeI/OmpD-associated family protein [Echinicola shivajiensis]